VTASATDLGSYAWVGRSNVAALNN